MKRHPELTVGAFILSRGRKLLLVKSPKWGGRYSIPGGHVEYGEPVKQAVAREAWEEVGLRVKPEKLLMVQEVIRPRQFFMRDRHFIFLDVLCHSSSTKPRLDGQEALSYLWVEPEKALRLPLEEYTRRLVASYVQSAHSRTAPATSIAWHCGAATSRQRRRPASRRSRYM